MENLATLYLLPLLVVVTGLVIEYWVIQPLKRSRNSANEGENRQPIVQVDDSGMKRKGLETISWAITGSTDVQDFKMLLLYFFRLAIAATIWAALGAIFGISAILLFSWFSIYILDVPVGGMFEGAKAAGAIAAIVFGIIRGIMWPIVEGLLSIKARK